MYVGFDVDQTLYLNNEFSGNQVPNYDLIQVLRWFYNNGENILVWSAGGIEYAQAIVNRLGLAEMVTCVEKSHAYPVHLTFDDQPVTMGLVNVLVKS